jgi:phosphatidate cytidylyltransferase
MNKMFLSNLAQRTPTGIFFVLIYGGILFFFQPIYFSILLFITLLIILCCEWPNFFSIFSKKFWLIMPFYPILPFACLIAINQQNQLLLILLFAMVFCFDTGAYLVGNVIGTHKLWAAISPGKTWEGFFGGYLAALIIFLLLNRWYLGHHFSFIFASLFTLITTITATAGDLFESWLKRQANIKDSGNLLPGHGGFLDRFDGILFVSVLFYMFHECHYINQLITS